MIDEKSLKDSMQDMETALIEVEQKLQAGRNRIAAYDKWLLSILHAICRAIYILLDREIRRIRINRFYNS